MSWADYTAAKSPWTDELIDQLKGLWKSGLSASQCARALGHEFSRNAIIGKIHRLKLPKRQTVVAKARINAGWSEQALERSSRRSEARRLIKASQPASIRKPPVERMHVDDAALKQPAWTPLPGTQPMGLMDLAEKTCRWPVGDPMAASTSFCGCQTMTGSSYCPSHYVRSIGPGTTFEQSAIRSAKWINRAERFVPDSEAA